MNEQIGLFSGSSNPELAQRIAEHMNQPLGKLKHSRFKSGEVYVHFEEGIRNRDVYLIQSFSPPVNDHFVELMVMIDAAKRASAKAIHLVVPYFGYARQERKSAPREPISAKMVSDVLSVLGANRVITLDLHSPAIQGFFNIPVDHLTALDLISDYIQSQQIPNPIIVSPDAGRVETAEKLANHLDYPFAIMIKKRPSHNESIITHIIGDVEGRTPIIIEDLIDTGSTIRNVVEGLKEKGARDAYICATHPVFSDSALERLHHPNIREVIITDTIAPQKQYPAFVKTISVSSLLAEAIQKNIYGGSISSLFRIKSV